MSLGPRDLGADGSGAAAAALRPARASLTHLAAELGALSRRRPLLLSLAIILPATLLAALGRATAYFETNDDSWMMLNLSGQVTSTSPTEYIVPINLWLCRALASLYRVAGGFPWYGWMLIAGVAVALVAILYSLMIGGFSPRRLGLFALCALLAGLPLAVMLQFTRVAFLLALSGLFLLEAALSADLAGDLPPARTRRRLAAAVLLLLFAFLLRKESLYLLTAIALPVLLHLVWTLWRGRALGKLLWTAGALVLLAAPLRYSHVRTYEQDPEWQRFEERKWLLKEFMDYERYPYTPDTKEYFDAVGWSYNDYLMMKTWFYVDAEHFSLEKVKDLRSRFPVSQWVTLPRILSAPRALFSRLAGDHLFWLTLSLFLAISFLAIREPSRVVAAVLMFAAAFGALMILVAFFKAPLRVYQPALTSISWLALLVSKAPASRAAGAARARLLDGAGIFFVVATLFLMTVLGGAPMRFVAHQSRLVVAANQNLRASLAEIEPRPSETYVSWGSGFPYEVILPLEEHSYLEDLRILMLGYSNGSPIQRRMMESQNLRDLPRDLFERPDVFLLIRAIDRGFQGLLVRYIGEHYGESVEVRSSFQSGTLGVWRVAREEPNGHEAEAGGANQK